MNRRTEVSAITMHTYGARIAWSRLPFPVRVAAAVTVGLVVDCSLFYWHFLAYPKRFIAQIAGEAS